MKGGREVDAGLDSVTRKASYKILSPSKVTEKLRLPMTGYLFEYNRIINKFYFLLHLVCRLAKWL